MPAWFNARARVVCLLMIVLGGFVVWGWTQRASLRPMQVRLGIPTSKVRASWRTFKYNEGGHFGTKTQYESQEADTAGGSYSLHCRDGKVYAIEVFYGSGIDRAQSIDAIKRILQTDLGKLTQHDNVELSLKDCSNPSEYFYFDNGKVGAQIDYDGATKQKVNHLYCWTSS